MSTDTFSPAPAGATRWLRADLAVLVLGLVGLGLWEWAGWDLAIARRFGTPDGFPWREHWLTSGLAHQGGRTLGWLVLGALVLDLWRPWIAGPSRAGRRHWFLATLLGLLAVPGLKRISSTSCPWDLAEFGGHVPYVPHWLLSVSDGGPGHCFPSGHAVAAFAFFSLWFLLREVRPGLARGCLAAVVAVGSLFGLAQLARGAHFPSHTLWSAWCCWSVCTLMAHNPWTPRTSDPAPAPPTPAGPPP